MNECKSLSKHSYNHNYCLIYNQGKIIVYQQNWMLVFRLVRIVKKMAKSSNNLKMEDLVKFLWTLEIRLLSQKLFCPIVNRVSGICQAHCLPKMHHSWNYVDAIHSSKKPRKFSYAMLKVRQFRKQIMVSSILPKN